MHTYRRVKHTHGVVRKVPRAGEECSVHNSRQEVAKTSQRNDLQSMSIKLKAQRSAFMFILRLLPSNVLRPAYAKLNALRRHFKLVRHGQQ